MNDTQKAIEFLKEEISVSPRYSKYWFTVEEIHANIGARCGIPALARNLRRRREWGELLSRKREGKSYMEYSFSGGYTTTDINNSFEKACNKIDKVNNKFLNSYLAPILIKIKEICGI